MHLIGDSPAGTYGGFRVVIKKLVKNIQKNSVRNNQKFQCKLSNSIEYK